MPSAKRKPKPAIRAKTGKTGRVPPPRTHRFKKGQSGNPSGRPRSKNFKEELTKFLREQDPSRKDGKDRMRTLMENLLESDPKILLYYYEGKPVETMQHQNADGTNILSGMVIKVSQDELPKSK